MFLIFNITIFYNVFNFQYHNLKIYNLIIFHIFNIAIIYNVFNLKIYNIPYFQYNIHNVIKLWYNNICDLNVLNVKNMVYADVNNIFCFNTPIQFYKLKTTLFFIEPYKSMVI